MLILNQVTLQQIEYTLQGEASEPLNKGTLAIKCKTKEKVSQEVMLVNNSDEMQFISVETDLSSLTGESKL